MTLWLAPKENARDPTVSAEFGRFYPLLASRQHISNCANVLQIKEACPAWPIFLSYARVVVSQCDELVWVGEAQTTVRNWSNFAIASLNRLSDKIKRELLSTLSTWIPFSSIDQIPFLKSRRMQLLRNNKNLSIVIPSESIQTRKSSLYDPEL